MTPRLPIEDPQRAAVEAEPSGNAMHFQEFEHWTSVDQPTGCQWVFGLFRKVNLKDENQYVLSFRDLGRTEFGYKELRGTTWWGRNLKKLANNIIAKKLLRKSLLSDDPELAAL